MFPSTLRSPARSGRVAYCKAGIDSARTRGHWTREKVRKLPNVRTDPVDLTGISEDKNVRVTAYLPNAAVTLQRVARSYSESSSRKVIIFMSKKLFGTDGIRGVAGEPPLDRRTVHAVGLALGKDMRERGHEEHASDRHGHARIRHLDRGGTRRGTEAPGRQSRFAGVVTTPGVAFLTRPIPFGAGVMISASHNPYQDNGIKVFGHSGFKLPDDGRAPDRAGDLPMLDADVDASEPNVWQWIRGSIASIWSICCPAGRRPLRRRQAGDRLRQRRGLASGAGAVPQPGRGSGRNRLRRRMAATSI